MIKNFKRRTVSLPADLEKSLLNLRKTDGFCNCSYSEIIRTLIKEGLKVTEMSDIEGMSKESL